MIKLSPKDLEFKKSPNFPGSINLTFAATALENIIYQRTNNEKDVRTIIGILIDGLRWEGVSQGCLNLSEHVERLVNMTSGYVFRRLIY